MLKRLLHLIGLKNDVLRKINFSILHLNASFKHLIDETPEVINYSWEPFDATNTNFIFLEYPFILVNFPPFKTKINCDELIDILNGKYDAESIETKLIEMIIKKIDN